MKRLTQCLLTGAVGLSVMTGARSLGHSAVSSAAEASQEGAIHTRADDLWFALLYLGVSAGSLAVGAGAGFVTHKATDDLVRRY